MKRILFFAVIIGSLIFGNVLCFAETERNVFEGSKDIEEVMQNIDIIQEDVSAFDITTEDLLFDRAIKDYISIDVFKEKIQGADEMREYLKDASYVYCVPANVDSGENAGAYYITIANGLEITEPDVLTEDDIEYLEKRIGKWFVSEIAVSEANSNSGITDCQLRMETFFRCYDIKSSETFFIGGAIPESIIMGICFQEGNNEPYYIALDKIDVNAESEDEIKDAVYTYDELKKYSKENKTNYSSEEIIFEGVTNTSNKTARFPVYTIAAIVVAAVAAIVVILRAKHSKKDKKCQQ